MHNIPSHIVSILPIEGTEAFEDGRMLQTYEVTAVSRISKETNTRRMKFSKQQLHAWANGEDLVQNCFPQLSPEDREFLMTGITPEEWDSMFGEEE